MKITLIEIIILLLVSSLLLMGGIALVMEPWLQKEVFTRGQVIGVMMIAGSLILTKWLRPRSR